MTKEEDAANEMVESAVGLLYQGFYNLFKQNKTDEVLLHMETLIAMLSNDMYEFRKQMKENKND